ncbi:MAG: hypothetical protein HQL56_06985 [Magnetococcales bacterium]|nr:hypothetical protein [Magnetococcales bacterium]
MEAVDEFTIDRLLEKYDDRRSLYVDFMNRQVTLLTEFLKENGPHVHSISGRVKERDSLRRKLMQPDCTYRQLEDISDLVGIRIITYFEDEVDLVAEVIRREFTINEAHILDRGEHLDPERFGYRSRHYMVSLLENRLQLIEYKRFKGCRAEIQVRSILQHAWSEIEQEMGYSSRETFPKERRRHFARVAHLLELGDEELNSIKQFIRPYQQAVAQTATRPRRGSFDLDSLGKFIHTNPLVREMDERFAGQIHANIHFSEAFVAELMDHMLAMEIDSLSAMEMELRSHRKSVLAIGRQILDQRPDIRYSSVWKGVCLFLTCYALAAESKQSGAMLAHMDKTIIGAIIENDDLFKDDIERW